MSSHTGTKCAKCIADYLRGLHRRREAELRLPTLEASQRFELDAPLVTMDGAAPVLLRAVSE